MKKGFTLIELLLVIAIIGILASIVLVALGESRKRASDTKVRAQITQGKNAAEIYFGANQNYGAVPNIDQASSGSSCSGSLFIDVSSGMLILANSSVYPGGTNLICIQNINDFAFAGSLSTPDEYWCADSSTGPGPITITTPGALTSADDSCADMAN
jgi:prepilin-type N-terminal cleavage/methylation domain-containing protein